MTVSFDYNHLGALTELTDPFRNFVYGNPAVYAYDDAGAGFKNIGRRCSS